DDDDLPRVPARLEGRRDPVDLVPQVALLVVHGEDDGDVELRLGSSGGGHGARKDRGAPPAWGLPSAPMKLPRSVVRAVARAKPLVPEAAWPVLTTLRSLPGDGPVVARPSFRSVL